MSLNRAAKTGAILTGVLLVMTLPAAASVSHPSRSIQTTSADSDVSPYSPGSNNLAIDVGQVFLMGGLNQYSDSIGEQLHYTYGVSDLFGFDSSLGYSSHSNGQFSMATALFGLRTNLSYYDKLIPYSIFGMGFYKPSFSYTASNGGQSSVSPILFGLHAGFGADLVLSQSLFFGASLTIHDIFGNDEATSTGNTISTGGAFISFLLHAGMSF